jgi:2-iminobutanoate/2-iminopropanoate deaminase
MKRLRHAVRFIGGVLTLLATQAVVGCAGRTQVAPAASAPATPATSRNLPEFVIPNRASSPFSSVVRVGNLLFVSGQIGTDSTGALPSGVAAQTTEAMKRISRLLGQAGSSLERVAKCTVMIADMREWNAMNAAYIAFFPQRRPARSSFGSNGLALGALVEIECIATVD